MSFTKANIGDQATTLKSDSIAQQLLISEKTLPYVSLPELKKNQSISTLRIKNEDELTTALVEPLIVSTPQDIIKTEEITKNSQLATIKRNQQLTDDDNKYNRVLTSAGVPVQSKSRIITQLISTKSDLIKAEESLQSTTKVQQLIITKPQVQLTERSIQSDKFNTQATIVKSSQESTKQLPLINDNDLAIKEGSYRQLAYNQEINKLAEQSELYKASNTVNTRKSLTVKATQSKQEVIQVPSSFEAKLLNSINPVYPSLAKRRGLEMEVKVDFIIDRDGKVKDISFAQQSKLIYFKSAIRSAIRKWRFSPAIINNRKVESKMTKIFSFSLHA